MLNRKGSWRPFNLWSYFIALVFFFTALQVSARLVVQLGFLKESLTLAQGFGAHFYGLRFDLRLACLAAGVPLLAGFMPWLHRWISPLHGQWFGPRGRLWWFWPSLAASLTSIWVMLVYADLGQMAYWQERLNVGVLYLLKDFRTNTKVLWDSYPVVWLSLFTVILASLTFRLTSRLARFCSEPSGLYQSKYTLLSREPLNGSQSAQRDWISTLWRRLARALPHLTMVFLVLLLIHGRWSQYPLRWSDLVRIGHPPAEVLAINPLQNIVDTLAYRRPQFDLTVTRRAYPAMSQYLQVESPNVQTLDFSRRSVPRADATLPKDSNVVVVIMESLSGYKTSLHGNRLDPTPFLKQLADEGWWFNRFASAHPLTARGVYSIVMSRPDVAAGDTASRNPGAIRHKSLVTAWQDHQPYYFIGGSTSWANVRGMLTKAVPQVKIYEEENFKTPRTDVWGLSDRNLFLESIGILNQHVEQKKSPFFAFIQTAANHRPYTIPIDDPDFKVLRKREAELIENGIGSGNEEYNAIRLMDHSVRVFMEKARQTAWFENTVFVFLGDHGTIGTVPSYMPAWMQAKEMATIHTPLILYAPKFLKPRRFDTLGQQADLLPTLIDLSGRAAELRGMGRSLLAERPGQAGLLYNMQVGGSQIGWFDGRYYAKRRQQDDANDSAPNPIQLYDLSDISRHQHNIASQNEALAQRLGDHLDAYYQTARYLLMNP
jgi:Sulfatase